MMEHDGRDLYNNIKPTLVVTLRNRRVFIMFCWYSLNMSRYQGTRFENWKQKCLAFAVFIWKITDIFTPYKIKYIVVHNRKVFSGFKVLVTYILTT